MQDHATHELHVEMPLPEGALGRLPDAGEGLGDQVLEVLALGQAPPVLMGPGHQVRVGELLELGFVGVDELDVVLQAAAFAALTEGAELLYEFHGENAFRDVRAIGGRALPIIGWALTANGWSLGKLPGYLISRSFSLTA